MPKEDYKPINDYAVIGNLRTAALVGTDGSIDWCCFPYLDRTSVFAALLDARRGGRFRVSVPGIERGRQWYVEDTNVLKTEFSGNAGRVTVTDLMPLSGDIEGRAGSFAPPELYPSLSASREAWRRRSSGRPGLTTPGGRPAFRGSPAAGSRLTGETT